jgi:hypothetical protein
MVSEPIDRAEWVRGITLESDFEVRLQANAIENRFKVAVLSAGDFAFKRPCRRWTITILLPGTKFVLR